jgi:RHS repeat-associated protein
MSPQFTGKERDAETALDFFDVRYLSGSQGRFTSPDLPFADWDPADPQSWNLYGYGRNNPFRNFDPRGRTCVTVTHLDGSSNQADNGDGKGCTDAGVNASSQNSGTTNSQDDERDSWRRNSTSTARLARYRRQRMS